jgi:hypothetical protein
MLSSCKSAPATESCQRDDSRRASQRLEGLHSTHCRRPARKRGKVSYVCSGEKPEVGNGLPGVEPLLAGPLAQSLVRRGYVLRSVQPDILQELLAGPWVWFKCHDHPSFSHHLGGQYRVHTGIRPDVVNPVSWFERVQEEAQAASSHGA